MQEDLELSEEESRCLEGVGVGVAGGYTGKLAGVALELIGMEVRGGSDRRLGR